MILQTHELFDLSHSIAGPLLSRCKYPHRALGLIGDFIKECSATLDDTYIEIAEDVFAADDAKIWDGATIVGPTIIGRRAEIRPGAFIRGKAIIGDGAVIGNSTEIKNSIIFDQAQLPHYNYVGDSIIGYRAHMGAGAIASNLRLDKREITLVGDEEGADSGLRKIGVFLGDYAEVGCGCVICPGGIIGRGAMVYPLTSVKGYIPEHTIYNGKTLKQLH
ncbi:MAG: UDP-N-acetylglucosamine pyrophosphorylase [Clostridia bacterium]|nr:UDP-N-acetylglucosamine pyrophosphorylase [Clostridia bacterium]